jgi:poly(A) polymerase/tRNA nucleotidyltransferase (CCA-adding enzyme)
VQATAVMRDPAVMNDEPALRIDPPDFLRDPALVAVLDALPDARVVGGAVRDALSGKPVADIDVATPLVPADVTAALKRAGIRAVPTGIDHGTVTAVVAHRGFEVTTLRRDLETDGRHAVVAFTADWQADAARRDFTINAMSMTRDGAVFDYFGGIGDLSAGIVRFVGDPATRIAEDYLRILRFFRFQARYAAEPTDTGTRQALTAGIPGLAGLSPERVWSELVRILSAPDPTGAVGLMQELGVLSAVLPEGGPGRAGVELLTSLVRAGAPADPLLRMAALLSGAAAGAGRPDPAALALRFRLSVAARDRLAALCTAPNPSPSADDPALRRLLADTDPAILIGRTWLVQAAEADDAAAWSALRDRIAAMQRPVFPLEGRDVLAMGLAPGPRVGVLLRDVRGWWLEGGCVASAAACRHRLTELLAAGPSPG